MLKTSTSRSGSSQDKYKEELLLAKINSAGIARHISEAMDESTLRHLLCVVIVNV